MQFTDDSVVFVDYNIKKNTQKKKNKFINKLIVQLEGYVLKVE
jgi:hypothetical protein